MPPARRIDPRDIVQLHREGMSYKAIGRALNCSHSYVRQIACAHGLTSNFRGRPPRVHLKPRDTSQCHPLVRQALELAPAEMTRADFAERLGYSYSTVSAVLSGRRWPTLPLLFDLITGLGLEIKLVPRSDTPPG